MTLPSTSTAIYLRNIFHQFTHYVPRIGTLHECVTLPSRIANAILGGISIEMKMKISFQLIPSCGQRDYHSMEVRLLSTLVLRVTFFNEVPPRSPPILSRVSIVGGRRRHGLLCASLRTSNAHTDRVFF